MLRSRDVQSRRGERLVHAVNGCVSFDKFAHPCIGVGSVFRDFLWFNFLVQLWLRGA